MVCVSYNQKEVMMQRCGANCLSRGTQCIGPRVLHLRYRKKGRDLEESGHEDQKAGQRYVMGAARKVFLTLDMMHVSS